jgi:two-component system, sensor histidine kinase
MSETMPERRKILVVEDDRVNQRVLKEMISELGHDPVVAVNGKEGVECAKKDKFMLIFMDIKMPVMDGYEAATAIREFDQNVPIIALTAYAQEWTPVKCVESGINDIIYKPAKAERIKKEIEKWAVAGQ